jgi:energy-coupling factor transporter ATP-binding protein EcfA2
VRALSYESVRFRYPDADRDALGGVDAEVGEGEFLLVVGASGCGKSTFLRAANGIVPHTTGGRFGGIVTVHGRTTRDHKPRDLADVVGFVHQDPEAQFVVEHVESDIAFALENLGYPEAAMRRRVEEMLDALAIAHLRDRSPATLSGGERQRVAIAGALAAAPRVLVLDEPTSQLDPQGADDVLAALARLNADLATTIVVAEHRLERAAPLADRVLHIDRGKVVDAGAPGAVLAGYAGASPVTRLAGHLGWNPPPLTVKAARALAAGLDIDAARAHAPASATPAPGERLVQARRLNVVLGGFQALHDVDFDLARGEVVALLGRNGAGKSTLLRSLAGLVTVASGLVDASGRVAYVPQDPNALFSAATAREEVATTLRLLRARDDGATSEWLERLQLSELGDRHPRTLSGGERQRLAIAAVAVGGAEVLLLDEPTRGMDAPSRAALESAARAHADAGGAVVLATHDVELAARLATRVVVLGHGEVVAAGKARDVLAGSLFAPQVLRVLPPFLTVEEAVTAFAAVRR